jgi:phosphogluconate dehydratase
MPELHHMTPALTSLLGRGFKVALITDGRMSGASGPVPAAIHLTPEADAGGPLARVRNGDVIRFDARAGTLELLGSDERWLQRPLARVTHDSRFGSGRELFATFRRLVGDAENGALCCIAQRH